jgi:hypothetical protein
VTRVCNGCKLRVLRTECHRNRYGEYICRACQSGGVRFTWRRRLYHHWRMLTIGFWILLALTALALLTAWAFHMMLLVPPAWMLR